MFSSPVDELLSTDLMKLKKGNFSINHDIISLDFAEASINTPLGDDSFVRWNGINDSIIYSITRHSCPTLIEEILSLEVPEDKITPDWLKLLEKHKALFDKKLLFDVDINAQSRNGILQISDIKRNSNNNDVKLLKIKNKKYI